jgi:hypothetical protein
MNPTITQPDLMSLPALARHLRVSQTWLRAEAEEGRIPSLPAGPGKFLFSKSAVEHALVDRASAANVEGGAK